MRLLFFSNVFPNSLLPTKGTFNAALVRALGEEGHSVHVVSPVAWTDRLSACLRGKSVSIAPKDPGPQVTARFPNYYYTPKLFRSRYDQFLDWSVRGGLDRDIATHQPEAIVSYWAHPDGAVALAAARRAGLPAITMVGGSDVLLLARRGPRRKAILKVLHGSDAVVAVSEDIATRLQTDGIDPERVHVIRRGVDRKLFSPGDRFAARAELGLPTDKHVLVAVGRLVPVKGFTFLIDACRRLHDRGVQIETHILGTGPLEGKLASQIRQLGLENCVHLSGAQPQQRLGDWYRAADLTVLSSLSEGVPNVLLESIACGTPFVASRVGGVPEIADPRAHRMVPARDSQALAMAIAESLAAPRFPVRLRFAPLSWSESVTRLCEVIESCRGTKEKSRAPRVELQDALC